MSESGSREPEGHDDELMDGPDEQRGVEGGAESSAVPATMTRLEHRIFTIRGRRVMLDVDLAAMYRVPPKRLNQQVKRNRARFPSDFLFQLTAKEDENLRLQTATSRSGHGGRRYLPFAFTEHGAVMLASVLKSPVAIEASIQVVRAFVRLRALAAAHKELAEKLDSLEAKYDEQFGVVFEAIRELMSAPSPSPRVRIGFLKSDDD